MSEWLAGKHAVAAALAGSARQVHEVVVRRGVAARDLGDILTSARTAKVPVSEIDARELQRAAGQNAAVCARVGPYRYRSEAELPPGADGGLVVVLDRIQDPQNLGAMVRTADAAGAAAVCIASRHSAQITPAVVRAAAGATEFIPIHRVVNIARTLERLSELGYWTVGLAPEAQLPWHSVDYAAPTALVIGAEGEGLRRLVADRCDYLVGLTMAGRVESLNASAAFAAVAYEVLRQRAAAR